MFDSFWLAPFDLDPWQKCEKMQWIYLKLIIFHYSTTWNCKLWKSWQYKVFWFELGTSLKLYTNKKVRYRLTVIETSVCLDVGHPTLIPEPSCKQSPKIWFIYWCSSKRIHVLVFIFSVFIQNLCLCFMAKRPQKDTTKDSIVNIYIISSCLMK